VCKHEEVLRQTIMVKYWTNFFTPEKSNNNNDVSDMFPFKMSSAVNGLLTSPSPQKFSSSGKPSTATPLKSAFSIRSILSETKRDKMGAEENLIEKERSDFKNNNDVKIDPGNSMH